MRKIYYSIFSLGSLLVLFAGILNFHPPATVKHLIPVAWAEDDDEYENEEDDDERESSTSSSSSSSSSTPQTKTQTVTKYELRSVQQTVEVTPPEYLKDTDGDGLVDALDPHPAISEKEFFTDTDGDGVANAFDKHHDADDFAFLPELDSEKLKGLVLAASESVPQPLPANPSILGEKNTLAWYLGRITGIIAFILLTLVTCFGLILSSRTLRDWFAPVTSLESHRAFSFLALGFVGLHVGSFFFDDFIHITGLEAFIPFVLKNGMTTAGGYALGTAVALGIIALYGVIILVLTSEWRSKMSIKVWRAIHYVSFVTYILFIAHGFAAGTDSTQWWMRAIYIISFTLVVILVRLRVLYRNAPSTMVPMKTTPLSSAISPEGIV